VSASAAAIAPALILAQPTASASGEYAVDPVEGMADATAPALILGNPVAGASGAYSDFEFFPPSLVFGVLREQAAFAVNPEQVAFVVRPEQVVFAVT
jgi:hypothetical protein